MVSDITVSKAPGLHFVSPYLRPSLPPSHLPFIPTYMYTLTYLPTYLPSFLPTSLLHSLLPQSTVANARLIMVFWRSAPPPQILTGSLRRNVTLWVGSPWPGAKSVGSNTCPPDATSLSLILGMDLRWRNIYRGRSEQASLTSVWMKYIHVVLYHPWISLKEERCMCDGCSMLESSLKSLGMRLAREVW